MSFTILLLIGIAVSARLQQTLDLSPTRTAELKGFSLLAVIFAHVGYYLVSDGRFLYPLSTIAGIAVNLFLFLSGYGLVKSLLKHTQTPLEFYRSRLPKLYLPLWITLGIALLTVQGRGISFPSPASIALAFLGVFPVADIYKSINSPLWYFTFIITHYLLFPWFFSVKHPLLSSLLFGAVMSTIAFLPLPVSEGVLQLYRLHVFLFPLGMLAASINWFRFAPSSTWKKYALCAVSIAIFVYAATHAHIGEGVWPEMLASFLGTAAVLVAFLTKPFESHLLTFFGKYSYELYLLHWPLLLSDRWLFPHLPATLALTVWIGLLSLASMTVHHLSKTVFTRINKPVR